jgi:hypothetical protein
MEQFKCLLVTTGVDIPHDHGDWRVFISLRQPQKLASDIDARVVSVPEDHGDLEDDIPLGHGLEEITCVVDVVG